MIRATMKNPRVIQTVTAKKMLKWIFLRTFNKVQEGVSTATANVENVLNNFIEALAILLVTSCLIPILVLIFFVWLVKIFAWTKY